LGRLESSGGCFPRQLAGEAAAMLSLAFSDRFPLGRPTYWENEVDADKLHFYRNATFTLSLVITEYIPISFWSGFDSGETEFNISGRRRPIFGQRHSVLRTLIVGQQSDGR
jgi:hypothetical protein